MVIKPPRHCHLDNNKFSPGYLKKLPTMDPYRSFLRFSKVISFWNKSALTPKAHEFSHINYLSPSSFLRWVLKTSATCDVTLQTAVACNFTFCLTRWGTWIVGVLHWPPFRSRCPSLPFIGAPRRRVTLSSYKQPSIASACCSQCPSGGPLLPRLPFLSFFSIHDDYQRQPVLW